MNIVHTLAVIPYSMHNMAVVSLVLYHVSLRPKQSRADSDRFRPTPVPRLRVMHPLVLYGVNWFYKSSNLVSTYRKALWSKPVSVMSAWSEPDLNSTVHADMLGACSAMRGLRRSRLRGPSTVSRCRKVKHFSSRRRNINASKAVFIALICAPSVPMPQRRRGQFCR